MRLGHDSFGMKIVYVANMRLPTEKAHGAQIMKTCEAFAQLGHDVELIVPNRVSAIIEDPFEYYGLVTRFPVRRLSVRDTVGKFGKLGFYIESISFAYAVRRYLRTSSCDLLYGRDEHILALLRRPYVWESHTGAWNAAARSVVRRARRVVTISQGLKDFYCTKGVDAEKIVVAHDGVDLTQFAHPVSKEEARSRLGLPGGAKVAMYIGRLDGWKGVETLLEASKLLDDEVVVAIVGGEAAQIERLSLAYPGVRFLGARPYRELADTMAAADVLVLPNTGNDEISVKFTSPLKLFAYMASGVPLVASDLPSIREVLDEDAAIFFPPDDATGLAQSVRHALQSDQTRARRALALVDSYTWKRRAQRILEACAGK